MKSCRRNKYPSRYDIYWDMNIPTQYYEEDYLEFEKYLEFTGLKKESTPENPHATSEFCLERFALFEKFRFNLFTFSKID